MFSQLKETLKQHQPIALTGAARHVMLWVSSLWSQETLPNPRAATSPATNQKTLTIYCIHGTADTRAAFSLVATRLLQDLPATYSAIRLVSFDDRGLGKSIEVFAEQLKLSILQNQDKDVVLMGHSRGGLVAAYFAENLAAAHGISVHAVIAICSPFAGSNLALPPLTWISGSVREMQKKSPFLAELTDKMNVSRIPYHYFSARDDSVVVPRDCCIEAHRDKLIELDRHGHLSILSSHRLVDYIRRDLLGVAASLDACQEANSRLIPG